MEEEEKAEREHHEEHEHHHEHHHDHDHHGEGEALEYGINTCVFSDVTPFSRILFEEIMPEVGRSVIRSKGFVWFREQPEIVYIFEQCGKQLSLQAASKWVAAMPERDRKQVLRDYPEIAESWNEKYGDRLNRVVFIGQGIHEEDIRSELVKALTE
jgi:G3E family GTPase